MSDPRHVSPLLFNRVRALAVVTATALAGLLGPTANLATAQAATAHPVTVVVTSPAGSSVERAATEKTVRDQFAGMAKYWADQSGGQVAFQLAKLNWWPGHGTCDGDAGAGVKAAKEQSGFVGGANKHILSLTAGCPSSNGVGSVGSGVDSGGWVYMERPDSSGTWSHEFGHNLGFSHANLLSCPGTAVDGELTGDGGSCTRGGYSDVLDTMGTSRDSTYKGLSTPGLIRTGLLGTKDYADVDSSAAVDRTVTIQSRDLLTGLRSVRIKDPRSGKRYYVDMASNDNYNAGVVSGSGSVKTVAGLEYRQNYGVRVMREDGQGTFLLGTPPDAQGMRYTAWNPGQTFTSASGGATIEVVSTTRTTATVRIRTRPTASPTAPVTSGSTHQIVNAGSSKAIDNPGSSLSAGRQLIQYQPRTSANQKWTFTANGDGTFAIKNGFSNLCVDVSGGSTTNNAAIIQWHCSGANNQRWTITPSGGGYQLVAQHSGKCLTVPGASTSNSTPLVQSACTAAANQRWMFAPAS